MDRETRQQLIAAYKDGYRVVAEALAGAKPDELDTAPGEGEVDGPADRASPRR